jgi:predicted N-formylglutamate amidohydrolase
MQVGSSKHTAVPGTTELSDDKPLNEQEVVVLPYTVSALWRNHTRKQSQDSPAFIYSQHVFTEF